jgi:uncharacterized protein YndB with AHSA1/START domain
VLTALRTRTIAASPQEVWEVVGDPHHLPRWWPRVQRVEAVEDDAFTEVLMSPKGKIVRADFKLLQAPGPRRVLWSQQVDGTPFERVLKGAETEIAVADGHGGEGPLAEVTIELRQTLQGRLPSRMSGRPTFLPARVVGLARFGSPLVQRAAAATIEEALDGLQRIVGRRS